MTALNPERIPTVAVAAMNQVHHEEAHLINALAEQLRRCAEGACEQHQIEEPLSRLLAHLQAHFAGEEARMRAAAFPAYPVHKAEHDRMLTQARAMAAIWRQDGGFAELQAFVQQTLPAWMLQHIATMDAVTAEFLRARERSAARV